MYRTEADYYLQGRFFDFSTLSLTFTCSEVAAPQYLHLSLFYNQNSIYITQPLVHN